MDLDNIQDKISNMDDRALVNALTRDKEDYQQAFLDCAAAELEKRNIRIPEVVSRLSVRRNALQKKGMSVDQALSLLKHPLSPWDVLYFENYMNDTIALQKGRSSWFFIHFKEKGPGRCYFVQERQQAEKTLSAFLSLEEWEALTGTQYDLTDWETFESSTSPAYIEILAEYFDMAGIPHMLKNLDHWGSCSGGCANHHGSPYTVLIHPGFVKQAKSIVAEKEAVTQALYQRLSEIEKSGDLNKMLDTINQIERLIPYDGSVQYNRGMILFELKRLDEAKAPLIRAAELYMEESNAEGLDEAAALLIKLSEKYSEDTALLHCLADACVFKNKAADAGQGYNAVLSINPEDSEAHRKLGYLFYDDPDARDKAVFHFRKYLELEPDAADFRQVSTFLERAG
jgi:Flp pilus assembly protein TadD